MTQRALADQTGLSIATISRLANNTTGQVSLRTLDRIAGALGVRPGRLLDRTPPKRTAKPRRR